MTFWSMELLWSSQQNSQSHKTSQVNVVLTHDVAVVLAKVYNMTKSAMYTGVSVSVVPMPRRLYPYKGRLGNRAFTLKCQ